MFPLNSRYILIAVLSSVAAAYNLPRENGHRMDTLLCLGKASAVLAQNRAFVPYDMRFL